MLLPRGNGKTTLTDALGLFPLLTEPRAAVYCAAASRDQARILFEAARDFAQHPLIASRVTVRHLELRAGAGHMRVIAADGPKQHGLALAQPSVEREGPLTDAQGDTLRMPEWSAPDDANADDPAVALECNPASWITEQGHAISVKRSTI